MNVRPLPVLLFFPFLVGLAALALPLHAQITTTLRSDGPTLLTPAAPFEATRVTRSTVRLSSGEELTEELHETIDRDSTGRISDRSTKNGKPDTFFTIADPTAQRLLQWKDGSQTAGSIPFSATTHLLISALVPPRGSTPNIPKTAESVSTQDLGQRTIAGLAAKGTRTLTTIAVGAMGNDKPLVVQHDVWISAELNLVLADSDESPFSGKRTSEFTSFERKSPPDTLFRLPDGLTIHPLNLPNQPNPAQNLAYNKALTDLIAPETREQAAGVLVEYAKTHPEVESHVAEVLAARRTHLDDAMTLAQQAVDSLEQQLQSIDARHVAVAEFKRMDQLAEDWDSLGWVYYAKNDSANAEKYCRAAWQLSGDGLFIEHLARLAQSSGDDDKARHLYQVELAARTNDAQKLRATKQLANLGVTNPTPAAAPTVVTIPTTQPLTGAADFNLVFNASYLQAEFLTGDPALGKLAAAVAGADIPSQLPDHGPEHVARRGHLVCASTCTLTLLYGPDAANTPAVAATAPRANGPQ